MIKLRLMIIPGVNEDAVSDLVRARIDRHVRDFLGIRYPKAKSAKAVATWSHQSSRYGYYVSVSEVKMEIAGAVVHILGDERIKIVPA